MLSAGEGRAEITPPLGTVLAGFHYAPGKERVVTGIRQPAQVRALALRFGDATAVILSLELCAVSRAFARRLQGRIQRDAGHSKAFVRVCATHTHSMPTLRPFLQWGDVSESYERDVESRAVEAARAALADLSEADCYIGKQGVRGGNFNRTTDTWKTDEVFTGESADTERWLDTLLQALYFQRAGNKKPILWYHFCAHPVCFGDGQAGPDWPGIVAQRIHAADGIEPGFLQGHIGDVNPGDGTPWIGDPEETVAAVAPAVHHAMGHGDLVMIGEMTFIESEARLDYDLERFENDLEMYRQDPEQCSSGVWVDAEFAKAWFERVSGRPPGEPALRVPVSALRLGSLALLFHPAELYSFYGLPIRTGSPFPHTLAVGYCDDFAGYLTDPKAYEQNEYAAVVVPKILGLPPFGRETARSFAQQCAEVLRSLA
jgi:hypothetical protein